MTVYRSLKDGKLYLIWQNVQAFYKGTGYYAECVTDSSRRISNARMKDFEVAWDQYSPK